jgi:hypothetical protein
MLRIGAQVGDAVIFPTRVVAVRAHVANPTFLEARANSLMIDEKAARLVMACELLTSFWNDS